LSDHQDVSVDKREEQEQLARDIGRELTDAFVAYVRGDVSFDDLTFGIYDALGDLHVIASGEYELEETEVEEDIEAQEVLDDDEDEQGPD
jgi:hypothetical protein